MQKKTAPSVIIYFIIYVFICTSLIVKGQDVCQTPENVTGTCVTITECSPVDSLARRTLMNPETVDYIKAIQCGFSGSLPKVCCTTTETKNPTDTSGLLPSAQICGNPSAGKIFGGEETDIRSFPWMAILEYQKPNRKEFSCGGALISKRYVLTAAHCLLRVPKSWKLISVRLGDHDLDKAKDCEYESQGVEFCNDPQDVDVEEAIPHKQYDPNDYNQPYDIALLRLSREVEYSAFISPICLPLSEDLKGKYYVGEKLTVAGWGRTESRSFSNVKLKVNVPVRLQSFCDPIYNKKGVTLVSTQICAGGEKAKDSCNGDSGGPLMVLDRIRDTDNYVAYGIVSFGPDPCGIENFPGIYTRVADYVDWIRDNMKP